MAEPSVTLAARPRPFELARLVQTVPQGLTLAEMVAVALPDPAHRPFAVVTIAGQRVTYPLERVRPAAGTLVEVTVVPQGGADLLRAVLVLAVVAASVYTGGLASAALGGGLLGAVGGAVATASISVGGLMAVNALVPPEPMQLAKSRDSSSNAYSITGSQNSIRLDGAVPQVLGRHRIYPDLATPTYTEQVDDDQFLVMLLELGYGPLAIERPRIGETDLAEFQDVETEEAFGALGVVPTVTLFPAIVEQERVGSDLRQDTGWVTHTTKLAMDGWSLDIAFPKGLIAYGKNTGDKLGQDIEFETRYSPVGANSWSTPENHVIHGRTGSPIRRALSGDFPSRGQYDFQIRRVSDDSDSDHIFNDSTWENFRSIRRENPVRRKGAQLYALRVRASRQLSGVIENFSLVATTVCPDWDAGTGTWISRATRNPASLFRWVLQGPANPKPVADSKLDLPALQDWHALCTAKGWTCDYVNDQDISTWELLRIVAACGRAFPTRPDSRWSVAVDTVKTTVVQHITPRNRTAGRWRRVIARQPHALRVTFVDGTDDAFKVGSERPVYADGYDETNATIFQDWEMPGVTDPDLIFKHGRKRLAEMILRPETYELDLDFENLVATRGDWIKLADDTVEIGSGWGRVTSLETSGGNTTALLIDERVVLDGVGSFVARARLSDGTSWLADIRGWSGENNRLELLTPAATASGPQAGDLVMVGLKGRETFDLLVKDIRRGKDLTATLTAVPLAPAVHTAEDGPIPAWDPQITQPAGSAAPIIWAVRSDGAALHRDADGSYRLAIVVTLYRDSTLPLAKFAAVEVSAQQVGTGAPAIGAENPADAQEVRLLNVELGEQYEIRARYRLLAGGYGPWSGVKVHTVVGPDLPPPDVSNPYLAGDRIAWLYDSPPPDFAGFRLRYTVRAGQPWETALSVSDGLYTLAFVLLQEIPQGAVELLIKAETTAGKLSTEAARIVVTGLEIPTAYEVTARDLQAEGFPGSTFDPGAGNALGIDTGDTIVDSTGDPLTLATGSAGQTGAEVVGGVLRSIDTSVWLDPPDGLWLSPPDALWLAGNFSTFMWVFQYTVPSVGKPTDRLRLDMAYTGEVWVEFRAADNSVLLGDNGDPLPLGSTPLPPGWVPLGGTLVGETTNPFVGWRNGLRAVPGQVLEFRVWGRGGTPVRASITKFRIVLEALEIREAVPGAAIPVNGGDVPSTTAWRSVVWAHALLRTGTNAVYVQRQDQPPSTAARLIAYDAQANSVAATADVTLGGY